MHIIKRRGHKEEYDERKVYGSVYAACLASHTSHEEAESIAGRVSEQLTSWIKERQEVTSTQIFYQVGEELKRLNPEAALMYTTHRDVS